MKYTVEALANIVNGKVIGDGSVQIENTRGFQEAEAQSITFAIGDYVEFINQSKAGAVIVEKEITNANRPLIVVSNAKVAFSTILSVFHPPVMIPDGIDPTALIGTNVKIGKGVKIRPYAIICDNAVIGDNVIIHPYVYVGHNVTIGDDTIVYPHVVIHENCNLGKRVVLRAGAIIGGEGFGFATENGCHRHIPQVGNVVLEDDVEIGACSCVDNATMGSTIVRRGTKVDNLVHLAHNVEIGEDCFIVAQVGIAGSTKCGNHCIFAGQSGAAGHLKIGDNVTFAARSGIMGHIPSNGNYAGFPLRPHREWLKHEAQLNRVGDMVKKIKCLEKELAELKESLKESL